MNRHRPAGARLVVRVAAVGVHGHDRRIVGHHVLALECFHEELLNFMLVCAAAAHAPSNFLERLGGNRVDHIARREVRLDLLFRQGRFKLRDQIRRANNVLAQPADHVRRSRIHHGNGEDNVVGRILHRHIAIRAQHLLQAVEQFLPSGILFLHARQGIQVSRFDLVNQFDGLAFGGDQVIPAPSDHEPIRQPENAVRDRIAMVMIVKKPGVDVAIAQGLLDGGEIHIQTVILHDRWRRWFSVDPNEIESPAPQPGSTGKATRALVMCFPLRLKNS